MSIQTGPSFTGNAIYGRATSSSADLLRLYQGGTMVFQVLQ